MYKFDIRSPPNSLEGSPFIIRFKTKNDKWSYSRYDKCLEGSPFIIRFKTELVQSNTDGILIKFRR